MKDQRLRVAPRKRISPKLELELEAQITAQTVTSLSTDGAVVAKVVGVAGDAFDIDTNGGARVTASGSTGKLAIHASGSATIDAKELKAQQVTIDVSGSAELDVFATDLLDVKISGSGKVRYYGNPRDVRKSISGSGKLEPR